jgi:hypothetical protein
MIRAKKYNKKSKFNPNFLMSKGENFKMLSCLGGKLGCETVRAGNLPLEIENCWYK